MSADAAAGDAGRRRWQQRYDAARKRDTDFTTLSGLVVDPVYGPPPDATYPGFDRIGWPGEYPFTRGLYATGYRGKPRSEEHTSELQSRRDLVCRLLLEKKKKKKD